MNVLRITLPALVAVTLTQTAAAQAPQSFLAFSGTGVIFYEPIKAEGDSIAQAEGLEVADALDQFDEATGKVAVYLSKTGIKFQFTTSPVIMVKLANGKVCRYERKALADIAGLILTDGVREPRLLSGIAEDPQMIAQINEFFGVKPAAEE